jgi:hypothetical protein
MNKDKDAVAKLLEKYKSLNHAVKEYLELLNIFFAAASLDEDNHCHLEGCIGWNRRNNHPKTSRFYPADNHIGTRAEKYNETILITMDESIQGVNKEVKV